MAGTGAYRLCTPPRSRAARDVGAEPPRRGIPPPVRPRRAWFVCATGAVVGTIAAAVLPSPWSIACGVLAGLGAVGAFVMFVVIVVLEDRDSAR
jgi:hypothetical protein